MTDCETYEVEIEMHAHRALDPAGLPALEAHLAQCPSCRRYQALARRTEQTMNAQSLDLNGLEARILALHDYRRSRSWWAIAVPGALGVALAMLTGHPGMVFATLLPVVAVVFGAIRLRVAYQARRAAQLARRREDFLAEYRRLLDGRIRRIRGLLMVIPFFGAITLANATLWNRWPASMHQPAVFAVIGLVLLAAFVRALLLWVRVVPALRKERRDLDAA